MNNLRFHCLNNLTVVEAQASDHHPIIMENICTFNMLCRCKVDNSHTNNGFNITETAFDYRERLINKLFPVIRELILEHKITLFAFQEAPPLMLSKDYREQELETFDVAKEFYNIITTKFNNYKIELQYYTPMWFGSEACGLLVIFHSNLVINKVITHAINPMISQKNKQRLQAIQIQSKHQGQQPFKLVNMHAHFENQLGTKEDIEKLIDNHFVVAGDFNLISWPEIKSTIQIVNKTDLGLMPTDTYDGIVKRGELPF